MTDLTTKTDAELSSLAGDALARMRAATGRLAKRSHRLDYSAVSSERNRRAWNAKTPEARAYGVLYQTQQTEPEWYALGEQDPYWLAMTAWVDGVMGSVEACEAHGIALADR